MKSIAAGRCTGKKLNLDQTLRNLTCGDLERWLVVMYRLGVPGLKKTKFVYLLDLFGGGGRMDGVISACGAPLDDWATGGSVDAFFTYGMVSVLWIVDPIPGNGYEV